MDFDKSSRFYDQENGINIYRYKLAFDQPERQFYLRLFSYRKPEKPSGQLINFLSDFTPQFRILGMEELTADYKVQGRFWTHPVPELNDQNLVEPLYRK